MHRDDNSKFLLYIEPKASEKLLVPVNDEITALMEKAFSDAISGAANYNKVNEPESFSPKSGFKGFHRTDCGEISTNHDYLLRNNLITNSLAVFYVRWYRNSIPPSDWDKIEKLKTFYDDGCAIGEKLPCSFCDNIHSWTVVCNAQKEWLRHKLWEGYLGVKQIS